MKATAAPAGASSIASRLAALRKRMTALKLDLYFVPSADEHQNEYLPPYKRRREAITGFAGSAGDAMIGIAEAHLWVDSRYHLEAEQTVDSSLIHVHKLGQPAVLDWFAWLKDHEAQAGPLRVGYDPMVISLRVVPHAQGTGLRLRGP